MVPSFPKSIATAEGFCPSMVLAVKVKEMSLTSAYLGTFKPRNFVPPLVKLTDFCEAAFVALNCVVSYSKEWFAACNSSSIVKEYV